MLATEAASCLQSGRGGPVEMAVAPLPWLRRTPHSSKTTRGTHMKSPPRYVLLPIALMFDVASIAARAEETPDATDKRVVENVTAAINADKGVQAGNRQKITA